MEKKNGQTATTEEVLSSLAYQMEALIQLLIEKKVFTREELIERIRLLAEEEHK